MPPEEKEDSPLKQIRTFQGDVVDALKSQNESLYSIRQKEGTMAVEEATGPKKVLLLLTGGLVLLALAGSFGFFAYKEYIRKTAPPVPVTPESRFISAEESAVVPNLSEFFKEVEDSPNQKLKHIIIATTSDPLGEARIPGVLKRAIETVFMTGALGQNPFAILKIKSYENAFAGMLEWERNFLQDTQSPSVFRDVVSRNKDIRVLSNSTSTPVVLYTILDNKWIIITNSLETLQTLIDRLTRQLLVQ